MQVYIFRLDEGTVVSIKYRMEVDCGWCHVYITNQQWELPGCRVNGDVYTAQVSVPWAKSTILTRYPKAFCIWVRYYEIAWTCTFNPLKTSKAQVHFIAMRASPIKDITLSLPGFLSFCQIVLGPALSMCVFGKQLQTLKCLWAKLTYLNCVNSSSLHGGEWGA